MRILTSLAALALVACGGGPDEGPAPTSTAVSPQSAAAPGTMARPVIPSRGAPASTPSEIAGRPDGAPCRAATDCASGVCEGQGCDGEGPVCKPKMRLCTKDLREYCGCDGQSFMSSGSCPRQPYKMRGPCKAPKAEPSGKPAGAACRSGKDCASGVCEGQGCDGKGPVCADTQRMCTKDLRPYCGCNGVTFRSSGSCPGRPYQHKGGCSASQ